MRFSPKFAAMIARRAGASLLVIVGVVTAVFVVQRLVPGDPVDTLLGEFALESDRQALRERLGLDQGLLQQYVGLWGDLLDGSLGESFALSATPRPVMELIRDNIGPTIVVPIAGVRSQG